MLNILNQYPPMARLIDAAWMRKNKSDMTDAQLAELFTSPMQPIEVLSRKDGAWKDVSAKERIWIITREGAMSKASMRSWLIKIANRRREMPPTKLTPDRCCAFANGAANVAYCRAGQNAEAYDKEVDLQLQDAISSMCGIPHIHDAKPMDDNRYD